MIDKEENIVSMKNLGPLKNEKDEFRRRENEETKRWTIQCEEDELGPSIIE